MKRKLRKIGENNSLIVTIPKYIVEQLGLSFDEEVNIICKGNKIIIEKIEGGE